jgi:hypothetical protein
MSLRLNDAVEAGLITFFYPPQGIAERVIGVEMQNWHPR